VVTLKNVDLYFDLLEQIKNLNFKDSKNLLPLCEKSWPLIPDLIADTIKEYGAFDIAEIPAIERPLPYLACRNDVEKLNFLSDLVNRYSELEPWREMVSRALNMIEVKNEIFSYIKQNPNVKQKDLKKVFPKIDYDLISELLYAADHLELIERTKSGNTYTLKLS